jgi:hypothetical protein
MHWRGNICHVTDSVSDVEKPCHATPAGETILFCHAIGNGVTKLNLLKIITL